LSFLANCRGELTPAARDVKNAAISSSFFAAKIEFVKAESQRYFVFQ
jgi:hypothetical protein